MAKYEPKQKNGKPATGGLFLQDCKLSDQDVLKGLQPTGTIPAFDDEKAAQASPAYFVNKRSEMIFTSCPIFLVEVPDDVVPSQVGSQKFISRDDIVKVISVFLDSGQETREVQKRKFESGELRFTYPRPYLNKYDVAWEKHATEEKGNPLNTLSAVVRELRGSLPASPCWTRLFCCFFDENRFTRIKLDAVSAAISRGGNAPLEELRSQQGEISSDARLSDYNQFLISAMRHLSKSKALGASRVSVLAAVPVPASATSTAITPILSL